AEIAPNRSGPSPLVQAAPAPAPAPAASVQKSDSITAAINGRGPYSSGVACLAQPNQDLEVVFNLPKSAEWPDLRAGQQPALPFGQSRLLSVGQSLRFDIQLFGGALSGSAPNGFKVNTGSNSGLLRCEIVFRDERTIVVPAQGGFPGADAARNLEARFSLPILVQYPTDRDGKGVIEGYPIGVYPNEAAPDAPASVADHIERYHPPKWFIKVTPETASLQISLHFKLGDFSPSEERGKDHFIALDVRLLDQLEGLTDALAKKGYAPGSLKILRAFLSPNEKTRLERQGVTYSPYTRYLYGDAAALIVDANGDGRMDDLNHDGKIDINDVDVLEEIASDVQKTAGRWGGLGVIAAPKEPSWPRTPYLDLDTRGFSSHWRVE
ncbi:MAG: hypothetical protein V2A74_03580, partial [bacterium]